MDDYICPLCERECTCSRPVLKIKLTIPQQKRGRGRPPKVPALDPPQVKRKPGRPRKNKLPDVPLPTFVPASAIPSASSVDSDSMDDMDDQIEQEEERFIRRGERERGKRDKKVERARIHRLQQQQKSILRDSIRHQQHQHQQQGRRESRYDPFHSDNDSDHCDPHPPHTEWVIRTRRPSDGNLQMDVDLSSSTASSDTSSSDEDDGDDDDDDDDGEQADEEPEEAAVEDEDDDEDDRPQYTGLATGWSDSEESSFDADLFFANLSDSHQGDSDSDTASEHDSLGHQASSSTQMQLDIPESQLFFPSTSPTFGFSPFFDFDASDLGLFSEPLSPPPQTLPEEDVCMPGIDHASPTDCEDDSDSDDDHGDNNGEEEEEEEEYTGYTTDEDLVGPDQLPNAKALKMFRLPNMDSRFPFDLAGLAGVDPLSTVSPSGSPAPIRSRSRTLSFSVFKAPGDILAGRIDEGTGPAVGPFSMANDQEISVVDDKHTMAPSPYHKRTRSKRDSISSHGSSIHSRDPSSSIAEFELTSSSEAGVPADSSPLVEQIALDDVLDPSFMEEDATWSDHSGDTNTGLASHLKRWDLIPVGAFRKTREGDSEANSSGWVSDKDYGSVIRQSPLNGLLWGNRAGSGGSSARSKMLMAISPLLDPLREEEGEKTPTTANHCKSTTNARKESRRDRKLRRKHLKGLQPHNHHHHSPTKNGGATHPYHQHHAHHQHYPNLKSRSASGSQRTNFFVPGSVPPLSL